jgi:hypothetical protein
VEVLLDVRNQRQEARRRALGGVPAELPGEAEHHVAVAEPLGADVLQRDLRSVHVVRSPLQQPVETTLELLRRHLLTAGDLDQRRPGHRVGGGQLDRPLGQPLCLVQPGDEGLDRLVRGVCGVHGPARRPRPLHGQLRADRGHQCVVGSRGEPFLDPLAVED